MVNWLKKIITNIRSKRITQNKIREAYLLKDDVFLKKAYRLGSDYLKPQIVSFIGEIPNQKNFNLLLNELKIVEDIRLKSYIFIGLMNIASYEDILINDKDSEYLNQNLVLLENIEFADYNPEVLEAGPIAFREKLMDHLGVLEEMKWRNRIY